MVSPLILRIEIIRPTVGSGKKQPLDAGVLATPGAASEGHDSAGKQAAFGYPVHSITFQNIQAPA